MTEPPVQREILIPPMLITIRNDGQDLVHTNYWETEQSEAGFMYLSTNAGCTRLLVPRAVLGQTVEDFLANATKGVSEIVMTRGTFEGHANAIEVLFEDGSPAPYSVIIDGKQVDRHWTPRDEGKRWHFAIYTQTDGKVIEFPCYLRSVVHLPFGMPYTGRRR